MEKPKSNSVEKMSFLKSERDGEFRKKLRIGDVKDGPDEGLERLGQTLVVDGWVQTLRVQSSFTFIEVISICSCSSWFDTLAFASYNSNAT